jgi:hypothetical protein
MPGAKPSAAPAAGAAPATEVAPTPEAAPKPEANPKSEVAPPQATPAQATPAQPAPKPEKPFDDVQLDKAVEVLGQMLAHPSAPAAPEPAPVGAGAAPQDY